MIDGAKLDFMEVTDQYVLFGNMIDNAINAVSKLPEGMERSIYLNVHAEKKLLLIQTENPFTGEVTFQDGLPKTSSGDEFNHGFGMKSIRLIAEKYHGSVSSRAKDGTFYVNVVIPL
jgi:sensor histidine kinase regulating citrate/malate metabolism